VVLAMMLQAGILAVEGLVTAWHATRILDRVVDETKMTALVSFSIETGKLSFTTFD
jgi:hypothetical protein